MAPPPELLILVTRNIIYPHILHRHIPELLEVLSSIENWRKHARGRAGLALEYHMSRDRLPPPCPRGLTDNDRNAFQPIVDTFSAIRNNYMKIMRQFCDLHLHYIWTTTTSVNEFITTYQKYFPLLVCDESVVVQPYPFIQSLSADETLEIAKSGKRWKDCIDQLTKDRSRKLKFDISNEEDLKKQIEAYLILVQRQIDTLEQVLDEDSYQQRVGGEKNIESSH
ncbi:hypothetical protein BDP27DRAFT_1315384 [Rhodocollybia butyracea]|uniref:Uncharacterized protein n=1 Tax=Rhodocollybia butyracea TaxID=206335 RepID=A0A9P5Q6P3_9AGAR|nr:hypothetical protein BDP27DRAFT_1315384 [Rhodocollybia butyracea]